MKTLATTICLLLYCVICSFIMHYIHYTKLERHHISLLTHFPLLLFYFYIFMLRNFTKNSHMDKELYKIGELMILSFLTVYCLNSKALISGATQKLIWFNGLNIVFITMVLTSSLRYGLFKK